MNLILIVIMGLSLSTDAFSLALAYGTQNIDKKYIFIQSIIVGIYHFFMPLLGIYVGVLFTRLIPIDPNIIVLIVLTIIGIEMIIEGIKEKKEIKKLSMFEMLMFGLAVSIDSFSAGISLKMISDDYILCSSIFSITSFIFTYLGLFLGKRANIIIGKVSTVIGGIILIVIGIIYIL